MRISPEMRDRLLESASRSGKTLTTEAEQRIEASYLKEDLLISVLKLACGDSNVAAIMMMTVKAFVRSGLAGAALAGPSDPDALDGWVHAAFPYDQGARAALAVIEAFRPEGSPELPTADKAFAETLRRGPKLRVAHILAAIADPRTGNQGLEPEAAEVRALMGEELLSRVKEAAGRLYRDDPT
jgi:hypothetical protein